MKADLGPTGPASIDKYRFYKAVLITLDAVRGFTARCAALAREKAQAAGGRDAVNKSSFLILRSVGQTRLPQPSLTVRYQKNLNQAVMNNGVDMTSGKRFVKDYGNFRDMEAFDDLMRALASDSAGAEGASK